MKPETFQQPVRPGLIYFRRVPELPYVRYYLWLHPKIQAPRRWLVAVHGISRDAREQVKLLRVAALETGHSVIAPIFHDTFFKGYQRLAPSDRISADRALEIILEDVEKAHPGEPEIDLCGFSGGAQFAHRYALCRPARVRSLIMTAAGWYTMPDPERVYPYGLAPSSGRPDLRFHLDRFLKIPHLVAVGNRDTTRDRNLRKRNHIDRQQGRNRLERAHRWYDAMQEAGARLGISGEVKRLTVLDNVGHRFSDAVHVGGLDKHIIQFLEARGETS